jgi:hypothetical protein
MKKASPYFPVGMRAVPATDPPQPADNRANTANPYFPVGVRGDAVWSAPETVLIDWTALNDTQTRLRAAQALFKQPNPILNLF